jgi:hypothetical protein
MDYTLQQELLEFFHKLLPQDSLDMFWEQEPYKGELFQIFEAAYARGVRVHGDDIWEWAREEFIADRDDLNDDDKQHLFAMCEAWSDWLYAWERMIVEVR